MSPIIPCSSDAFALLVHQQSNKADYGASFIRCVDSCQRFAKRSGLVDKWGQDKVQFYLAQAFGHIKRRRR